MRADCWSRCSVRSRWRARPEDFIQTLNCGWRLNELPRREVIRLRHLSPHELAELLDRHAKPLAMYARQWTDRSDDCVQEAFVKLAAAERPANPVAWLFRVVRNMALNSVRAEKRRKQHESHAASRSTRFASPSLALDRQEEFDRLMQSLKKLDDQSKELVVLRVWSELTWAEIGQVTGLAPSSAHRKYTDALQRLKQIMSSNLVNHDE